MSGVVLTCTDNFTQESARYIKDGRLVIYPTDTLYGVGCSAIDKDAIRKVFEVKRRDLSKPLSIAVCDLKMLRKYTIFDEKAMRVMERFFPGPVTLILKKRNLPDILTSGSDKVGVRIPECRTTLKLVMASMVPIVSTSANISGREPPETAEEALEQLPGVELVIDAGRLISLPSTVVDLTEDPPRILREGKKPVLEIRTVLDEVYGT